MSKKEISLGTTVLAIQVEDGIFIGADSKTSTGSLISNKISDKISYLSETIVCCRSGSAADTQNVVDFIRSLILQHLLASKTMPKVRMISQILRNFCYKEGNLNVGFICAGWDNSHGYQLFNVSMSGCIFKQPLILVGSGSIFIQGFCDSNFKKEMNEFEVKDFLIKAISLAILRDSSSGGVIRVAKITKKGIERVVVRPIKPVKKIPKKSKTNIVIV